VTTTDGREEKPKTPEEIEAEKKKKMVEEELNELRNFKKKVEEKELSDLKNTLASIVGKQLENMDKMTKAEVENAISIAEATKKNINIEPQINHTNTQPEGPAKAEENKRKKNAGWVYNQAKREYEWKEY